MATTESRRPVVASPRARRIDPGGFARHSWHYALAVVPVLAITWLFNTVALYVATWLPAGSGLRLGLGGSHWSPGSCSPLAQLIPEAVLAILSIPFIIVTLGFFYFLINVFMLYLTHWIVPQFTLDSFWWAALAAAIISIVNGILHAAFGRPGELRRTLSPRVSAWVRLIGGTRRGHGGPEYAVTMPAYVQRRRPSDMSSCLSSGRV